MGLGGGPCPSTGSSWEASIPLPSHMPTETFQPLEFLRTSLGGSFLVFESFLYRKEKKIGDKVYWMCREHGRRGCRSRAITQGQQVTVMRAHCHPPDLRSLEALREREKHPSPAPQDEAGMSGCGDKGQGL